MDEGNMFLLLEMLGLCDVCLATISVITADYSFAVQHPTIDSFRASLEQKCYICLCLQAFVNVGGASDFLLGLLYTQYTLYPYDTHDYMMMCCFSWDSTKALQLFYFYKSQG